MTLLPLIAPSGRQFLAPTVSINNRYLEFYTPIQRILKLYNGDHSITVLIDARNQCFLLQKCISANYSCFWGVECISQAEGYLMPINPLFLWYSFLANEAKAHPPMDMLAEWRAACQKLPLEPPNSLDSPPAVMRRVLDMIQDRSKLISESLPTYSGWLSDPITKIRWRKMETPQLCFILDLLKVVVGTFVVEGVCDELGIARPQSADSMEIALAPTVADKEHSASQGKKTEAPKKKKFTEDDFKGHKSLTSFFKKADPGAAA